MSINESLGSWRYEVCPVGAINCIIPILTPTYGGTACCSFVKIEDRACDTCYAKCFWKTRPKNI